MYFDKYIGIDWSGDKNSFQKGISIAKTNPILRDAIRIGGTESFKTNLVKGNALP